MAIGDDSRHANAILFIQLGLYILALILSLIICVPMSMHQEQFKGHCLLFSTGTWRQADGQFVVDWASQAYCNFTIFVAVIMFTISATQIFRYCKFLYKGKDSSFLSAFIDVIVSGFMTIMVLLAGLFVTLGFKQWCGEMTRRFDFCSDATANDIDKAEMIDMSGFFVQLNTAQLGVWTAFSTWGGIITTSMLKLCRYHHQENLRVSMAKERKRLINEDLVSEVPVSRSHSGPSVGGRRGHRRTKSGNQNNEVFEEVTEGGTDNPAGNQIHIQDQQMSIPRPDLLNY